MNSLVNEGPDPQEQRCFMKGISARRIKVKLGEVWESPNLHILFTREDEVIVARCLDFTISSHGEDEKEALESLGMALKEYILTAVEDKAMDILYDPAQNKYWRMFNDLEAKTNIADLKKSFNKSIKFFTVDTAKEIRPEISYA